jgi:hypothetical protein
MIVALSMIPSAARAAAVIDLQMDEGMGNTAFDSSGKGNDGTLTDLNGNGSIGWATGHAGNGVTMNPDPDKDYIKVLSSASLDITGAFYASMWIYPTGSGVEYDIGSGVMWEFMTRADGGWSKGKSYGMYIPANTNVHGVLAFQTYGTKDFNGPAAGDPINNTHELGRMKVNQWNKVAMDFDGVDTYHLYLNDNLSFTGVLPGPDQLALSSDHLYIGTNRWTGGYMEGIYDEFKIVPEPGTWLLLGSGLLGIASAIRRRSRA